MRHGAILVWALLGGLPALYPREAVATVVWGDVHAHSGLSDDATGSPAAFFVHARDDIGLDFVVLSDHDLYLTADEWATLRTLAAAYDEPGRFVALPGVEWTRAYHLNAVFRHDDQAICSGGGGPPCLTAADFLAFYGPGVRAGTAAAHVNHPSWGVPWPEFDDHVLTNAEVWNTLHDRVYRDDADVHSDDPRPGGILWAQRAGMRVGFVGASDDHRLLFLGGNLLGSALTGCHVAALDRDEILYALATRRCYATNGERIVVDFTVDGTPMGGELVVPLHTIVTARIDVIGTATPTAIELLRNGAAVATRTDCAAPACVLEAPVAIDDEHTFLYARVHQPGDRHAWVSPVWVRGACVQPDDCPADRIVPARGQVDEECVVHWRVLPRTDRTATGSALARVTCIDGDPACDAGDTPNECTFRVDLCFGGGSPGACPQGPVGFRDLMRPMPTSVQGVENRFTLLTAMAALDPAGACSPWVDVHVPLRPAKSGYRGRTYPLVVRALAGPVLDRDVVRLVCLPAAP